MEVTMEMGEVTTCLHLHSRHVGPIKQSQSLASPVLWNGLCPAGSVEIDQRVSNEDIADA